MKRRKERQEEAAAAAAAKEAAKLAGKKRPAEAKKEPPAKEAKGDGGQDWILDPKQERLRFLPPPQDHQALRQEDRDLPCRDRRGGV